MNKEDKKIFEILNKDIQIPQSYFDTVYHTLEQLPSKSKKKTKLNKYTLTFATACCSLILITSVVFAKDIENYLKKIFAYSTPAIDSAVENGFVQNVNDNFTYNNNIGIKVDNLVYDNLNLAISFNYETQMKNINSISLDRFTISTDNDDLIYEYEQADKVTVGLANSMSRALQPIKVTDTTFSDSVLFGLRQKEISFNKLHFEIRSVRLEHIDNTFEIEEGNWKFDVVINDEMKKSENYYYKMNDNNKYVESCTGILSATGMIIELNIVNDFDLEKYLNLELRSSPDFFVLKNSDNTFNPSQLNLDINNELVLHYDNIGKFFNNIDNFELYLPFLNSPITLNKKSYLQKKID